MVTAQHVEKKIPLTILETKCDNKTMQFVVESDTPLETCLQALNEFINYVNEMKYQLEQKQVEESKQLEDAPKDEAV